VKKLLSLALIFFATACQEAPSGYTPQPFLFGNPLRFNVAEVKVIENYRSPMQAPNAEQDFPVSPANAVRQWAQQRLLAAGSAGSLEVSIDEASVKAVPLKKTKGLKGVFTDDQDARYDAVLKVQFRLYDGESAMSRASADVVITRSRTINEKATVMDRQKLFDDMTHEIMAQFDTQANARFLQYFTGWIR
jgi:hypothetical protein